MAEVGLGLTGLTLLNRVDLALVDFALANNEVLEVYCCDPDEILASLASLQIMRWFFHSSLVTFITT
jgi:hypothetical protein